MIQLYDFIIKTFIGTTLISISYIGFGMLKDYVEISYSESEKNKKEN